MASRIRGITIEIGGDTTGLNKALQGTNKEINKTQYALQDVEKALKIDPKNVDLLAQKERLLGDAVKATTEKLKTLKEAQRQATEQLARGDIGQDQYDALTREIVQTAAALKRATDAADEFARSNTELNRTLTDISTSAGSVANATRGLSVASAAVVVGIATAAIKTAEWADDLKTLSQQTGISTDELQKMQYASELVDVSVETMTGALAKLTRNMASTSATTQAAFAQLGVSVTDVNGNVKDAEIVFYEVLAALSRVGNETERDQLAMDLFGRSANELAGIIDDGGAALKAYGDEAERNGAIVDESLVNSMAAFQDKIDQFKAAALPELLQAGGAAIEALTPLLESLITVLASLLQIIGETDPVLLQVVTTMALFGASIAPISAGLATLTKAVALFSTAGLGKLIATLNTTGGQLTAIIAIIGVFALLVTQIVNAWDDMSGFEKAISVFGALVVAASAAAIALGAVQSAATMGIAAAAIVAGIIAVTAAVNAANKRASTAKIDPRTGLPMMADGGILSRGSAIVGEAGPELLTMNNGRAVVQPLTNNTYTTNYNASTQPIQVTLSLDGQALATQLVRPMRDASVMAGGSNMR